MPVSVANSQVIYDALKACDVKIISALPETWLVHLIRMADETRSHPGTRRQGRGGDWHLRRGTPGRRQLRTADAEPRLPRSNQPDRLAGTAL